MNSWRTAESNPISKLCATSRGNSIPRALEVTRDYNWRILFFGTRKFRIFYYAFIITVLLIFLTFILHDPFTKHLFTFFK